MLTAQGGVCGTELNSRWEEALRLGNASWEPKRAKWGSSWGPEAQCLTALASHMPQSTCDVTHPKRTSGCPSPKSLLLPMKLWVWLMPSLLSFLETSTSPFIFPSHSPNSWVTGSCWGSLSDVSGTILLTGTSDKALAEPEYLAGLWQQWLNWFSYLQPLLV